MKVAAQVPIVAIVEEEDSIDILQLTGATTVLKRQLGEYLATRVDVGRAEAHVIGAFRGLRRNVEAIHRAGADFVLGYTTLGIEAVMSILKGNPPVLLGEGVELFSLRVPPSLAAGRSRTLGSALARGSASVRSSRETKLVAP